MVDHELSNDLLDPRSRMSHSRRFRDDKPTSEFLSYEDFKAYRAKCRNPSDLPRDHHFYSFAHKDLENRKEAAGTQEELKYIDEFEEQDDFYLSKFMTPKQLAALK